MLIFRKTGMEKGKVLFIFKTVIFMAFVLAMMNSCEITDPDPDNPFDQKPVKHVYEVFDMSIEVENHAPILSKDNEDCLKCSISVNGKGFFKDFEGSGRIRGRGNSSWLWYDKKPYRIKLDEKQGLLGLGSNSDWVLLANYRDPTDLMNTFGFEVSDWLGLPFSNHTRYVEVTLNGDFIGLYQMTEQVEQGSNRVDVSEISGWLISLDLDDGPGLSVGTGDNFWSSVFKLPVAVKYPALPTELELTAIRNDFSVLERFINDFNYDSVSTLLDIPSFINYLILEELVYNVEIDAPRSVFLFKEEGSKYFFGPSWDFDAGFDFDWGTMVTGHNYFHEQELVLGTDPVNHTRGYRISGFFTQMFRNHRFVSEFKSRWLEVKDSIFDHAWGVMEGYISCLQDALARENSRWPIDRHYNTEIMRMQDWLSDRVDYLSEVIENYPPGYLPLTRIDCGTVHLDITMSYALGYAQEVRVNIDEEQLLKMLEINVDQLNSQNMRIVPLRTDGSDGENFTNGIFGGWFEADNNPGYWSNGHVYIEVFENRTSWNCGLRAEEGFCSVGETHKVRMQYQFTQGSDLRTVTVEVNFTIDP